MINNRPVYNYLQGGTFWESLPIDLMDVEKIEVIRGPSSTLYGPNAVSGVINIITTRTSKDGLQVSGRVQSGTQKTSIANAAVAYKFSKQWSAGVSGNFQTRGRDVRYMNYITDTWVSSVNDLSFANAQERYPHPDKSMIKYGANSYIQYTPKEDIEINLAGGLQDAEVQNILFDNSAANLSTASTRSQYVDLHANAYGFTTQFSYTTAAQAPVVGMPGSKYDYHVADASVEYALTVKSLSIKPSFTYRSAVYDDRAYWETEKGEGTINGRRMMETLGGGIRLEYKLLEDKLRLTGGVRADKFTYPKGWFTSYQAAAGYKVSENTLLRFVYSKAFRSPFIFDTYLDYTTVNPTGNADTYAQYETMGNKDLSLLSSAMTELGFRTRIATNFSLDVELYSTRTDNYTSLIQGETTLTPQNYPIVASTVLTMENLPLWVRQNGATISLHAVLGKFQLKPFVTFQKTTLHDYSPYYNNTAAVPSMLNNNNPAANNVNSGIGQETDHKFTPKAYGGAYLNYAPHSKFMVNVTTYWFSKQTFFMRDNIVYQDGVHGVENIEGKVLLNAKVTYKPVESLSVFVNGRNLLVQKSVEYYDADVTPVMLLGGVNFQF
jgi:iron complex outermembrane receptor protein